LRPLEKKPRKITLENMLANFQGCVLVKRLASKQVSP